MTRRPTSALVPGSPRSIASPVDACSRSPRATGRSSRPAIGRGRGTHRRAAARPAARRDRRARGAACRGPARAGPAEPRRGAERGRDAASTLHWRGRWRVATGDIADPLETPFAGIVRDVRPGTGITIRAAGRGIRGIVALGGPTRGRLQRRRGRRAAARAASTSGSAGTILVVGSRVDAETLTRARAMGVRGIVVAGLASKERRDFLASEARQRAALHRLPPFAVLVLDGAIRRPLAGAVQAVLGGAGRPRGGDRHRPADARLRQAEPGHPGAAGRPRPGPGRRAGRARGPVRRGDRPAPVRRRRPPRGRLVRLADGTDAAVPLGDLERFV